MKKEYIPKTYIYDHIPKWTHYGRWDTLGLKLYGKDPYNPILDYTDYQIRKPQKKGTESE